MLGIHVRNFDLTLMGIKRVSDPVEHSLQRVCAKRIVQIKDGSFREIEIFSLAADDRDFSSPISHSLRIGDSSVRQLLHVVDSDNSSDGVTSGAADHASFTASEVDENIGLRQLEITQD